MSFKKQVKRILLKVKKLALTSDLWKNKTKKYFLGFTAHFFDDYLNYHSLVIGFRKFGKNHTSDNIKRFITKELGTDLLDKVKI
jgi:hypothetical protein